jgi:hypothetical protein
VGHEGGSHAEGRRGAAGRVARPSTGIGDSVTVDRRSVGILFRPSLPPDADMTFTTEEILALVAVGVILAIIVTAYMVISRRKGWM